VNHYEALSLQDEGQAPQVFDGSRDGTEQAGIIRCGLHAIQLPRMIRQQSRHQKVMVSCHRGEIQSAHARQGAVPKRQPSDKVSQAVNGIGLDPFHNLKAGFESVVVAMNVAEKRDAHLGSYSSTVSKLPSSFWMIFMCRPLESVNLIGPP
jgi:hypothetical protein